MEPAATLRGSKVPVAIIAGARDNIIPKARTDALRSAVGTRVYDRTIAGAGHNDIYDDAEFRGSMRAALGAVLA